MARIVDAILDSVIYLYRSERAALQGDEEGGTGFLLGFPSRVHDEQLHIYAVTNSHVIAMGCPVIRLTTARGETKLFPFRDDHWIRHPDGDDLAICPVSLPSEERLSVVHLMQLIEQRHIEHYRIGPGDEIFMVGRFVGAGGKQRNTPAARFGKVAQMPAEPITRGFSGHKQLSFLVELQTMSGYSGSPVFVQILPFQPRPVPISDPPGYAFELPREERLWLLGIDWGHLSHSERVVDEGGKPHPEGWRLNSNSFMGVVVPAWKLREILRLGELEKQREEEDRRFTEELKGGAVPDV